MIFLILLNIFTLIFQANNDQYKTGSNYLLYADDTINTIFIIEMVLRICADGLIINKGSYLRNTWNRFDFFINVCLISYYLFMDYSDNLLMKTLKAMRTFRPLRIISHIKGLELILLSLISALPLLIDTLLIFAFFYIFFAIAGLQLFTGMLKNRCVYHNGTNRVETDFFCGNIQCPKVLNHTLSINELRDFFASFFIKKKRR